MLAISVCIRRTLILQYTCCLFLVGTLFPSCCWGDEKEALAILRDEGLVVQGAFLVTEPEVELRRRLADEKKLRKEAVLARRTLDQALTLDANRKLTIKQLRDQHRVLNAGLAQAETARENNQIVAALTEISHQLNQLNETEEVEKQLATRQAAFAQARENYVGNVLAARKAADAAEELWRQLPERARVVEAVEAYNSQAKTKIQLTPAKGFSGQLRTLAKLEENVLSESIELQRDGGNTFMVDVVVNGNKTLNMVVDSGASLVCLPYRDAVAANVDLDTNAETIILSIADGSQVPAQRVVLPNVRVGKFSVDRVEAAILPPELKNAPALLGMSFLRNFEFSLDSDASRLSLTQLSVDAPKPSEKQNSSRESRRSAK